MAKKESSKEFYRKMVQTDFSHQIRAEKERREALGIFIGVPLFIFLVVFSVILGVLLPLKLLGVV